MQDRKSSAARYPVGFTPRTATVTTWWSVLTVSPPPPPGVRSRLQLRLWQRRWCSPVGHSIHDRKWNIPSALTHLEHIDALFIRPPKPDVSARGVSSLCCSHTDNDDLRGWTCVMSPLQVYRRYMCYYMNKQPLSLKLCNKRLKYSVYRTIAESVM